MSNSNLSPMEQLIGFVEVERQRNPGVTHIAEWALAEIERLHCDAARYRTLREMDWWQSPLCVVVDPKINVKLGSDCPSRERLDAMVDAARSTK